MKIQKQSRFKNPNKDVNIYEKIISKEKPFIKISSSLPDLTPHKISEITSSRGNTQKELLPKKYKDAIASLKSYTAKDKDCSYIGKVWILFGVKSDSTKVPINVGQTTKLFNEISEIIWNIMIEQEGPYFDEIQHYSFFEFYELDPQKIILGVWNNENQLKELAYNMVKEYYAEVLLAYVTSAKNWNYYGSGIDKRFLNWLVEKESEKYAFITSQEV